MSGWGGARQGAGRKANPFRTVKQELEVRRKAGHRLLEGALRLQQLGAEPTSAVQDAICAARRIIRKASQTELAMDNAPMPERKRVEMAKTALDFWSKT